MNEKVEQLIEAMNEDLRRHRQLAKVLDAKLDAMRKRDLERLEALTVDQHDLLASIADNGCKRNSLVGQLTDMFFPARRKPSRASAGEIAAAVGEPYQGKIMALKAMLLDVAQKVQRLNHINEIATLKILGHVDCIFNIIAQSGRDIGLYGRAGKQDVVEHNRLVDAIA